MPRLGELKDAMATWSVAQRPMSDVVRWGNFPDYGQTLGQHVNSLPSVVMFVKSFLTRSRNIDWSILYECAHLHDHGEPLSGGDEHDGNKTDDKELREYHAFRELVSADPECLQTMKMTAFMLPYVRKQKWWPELEPADQVMVRDLSTTYYREAVIFEFIERLDYVFSGLEGHARGIRNKEETMLEHVLRKQVPKFDSLVVELKLLGQVWDSDLKSELLQLKASSAQDK